MWRRDGAIVGSGRLDGGAALTGLSRERRVVFLLERGKKRPITRGGQERLADRVQDVSIKGVGLEMDGVKTGVHLFGRRGLVVAVRFCK